MLVFFSPNFHQIAHNSSNMKIFWSSKYLCTRYNMLVCQWLMAGRWFSPSTLVSSTNKTDHYHITEILWKVMLNTITITLTPNLKQKAFKFLSFYIPHPLRLWQEILVLSWLLLLSVFLHHLILILVHQPPFHIL